METQIMKVGEKGQVTLPVSIREAEGIGKGTLVEVINLGGGLLFLSKADKKQEFRLAMKLLGSKLAEKGYSNEKIVELCKEIRKEIYNESAS